jgi:hypothetical protein
MTWITPDPAQIEKQYIVSKAILEQELFNRDVVLIGGSASVDDLRFDFSNDTRFFIQLNHHLTRRKYQPCHWLVARAGSGMEYSVFKTKIPEYQQKRVRVVSTACNKHTFETWQPYYPVFPFHEIRHVGLNPFHPCIEWCNQFWNELETNPFVGMIALKMALMFPIKSIELIGFDFYNGECGEIRKNIGCHNLEKQINWFKHVYNTDFRITIDDNLKHVLHLSDSDRFKPLAFDLNA